MVLDSIGETSCGVDYSAQIGRIEVQITQIEEKKDKLLELSMADAITLQEFKERNTRFNRQISALEEQRVAMCQQEQRQKETEVDPKTLEKPCVRSWTLRMESNPKSWRRFWITLWCWNKATISKSI